MRATLPYAKERRASSWWTLGSTFSLMIGAAAVAIAAPWWPLRVVASLVTGLSMVRAFILVHDVHHGAIFRGSRVAKAILNFYGLILLTPGQIWRDTHNYHHAHTAKTDGRQRGTFTLFTTKQWREANFWTKLAYRIERHPITLACGYATIFILSFGIAPFLRNPKRNWDSGLALLVHSAVGAAILYFGGTSAFILGFIIPFVIAGSMGGLLFYVQHNFEGMHIPVKDEWNHTDASLEASSFLKLGPVMRWFTGNIGFHHIHHLNPKIPFYRLPEAMKSIPEFAQPHTITLSPRTVVRSFRMKLWDPDADRMVSYRAAHSRT